ncbi:MAG: type II secretion system protein, partial [Planctomycetota bacterium]
MTGRNSRKSRRGWSLVEMIAVITMMAVLATLLVPVLFNGFLAYRNLRGEINWIESTSRLGITLRRDIRHASHAEIIEKQDSQSLNLTSPDSSITYTFANGNLVRDLKSNKDRTNPTSREGFVMPADASLDWKIEQRLAPVVSLEMDLPGPHQNSDRRQ